MPINVTLGSTVVFTVEFFSSTQQLTTPTSASVTITYPPSSNNITTVSCTISMSLTGQFFTASWGSAVAALGIVNYSVSGAGQASPTTGQLKLTTP